ncbi:thioredoxin [Christensenellaceae bacterium NSJ-44]|uniref:Thioredoxin n=1 Tax=Luoshenia tenuis TaxID=2763654 RepID=A0A926CZG1_9FIRM|nr:thioredoxin [Luoshenia tenuis]
MEVAVSKNKRSFPWLTAGLIAAGAVLLGIGYFRGEMETVLRKAVTICLECIGIG